MAEKLPWFPYYPADFQTDERVALMSYEAEGIYQALLRHQWLNGSIPSDREELRRMLKPHAGEALEAALTCFVPVPRSNASSNRSTASRCFNQRLEAERESASRSHHRRIEAGRQGGIRSGVSRRSNASARGEAMLKQSQPQPQERQKQRQNPPTPLSAPADAAPAPADNSRLGKPTWLSPYLELYAGVEGMLPPKRLAAAVAPVRAAQGDALALESFARWAGSADVRFGAEWWAAHWRQFTNDGRPRRLSQQDRNEAAIDAWVGPEEEGHDGE